MKSKRCVLFFVLTAMIVSLIYSSSTSVVSAAPPSASVDGITAVEYADQYKVLNGPVYKSYYLRGDNREFDVQFLKTNFIDPLLSGVSLYNAVVVGEEAANGYILVQESHVDAWINYYSATNSKAYRDKIKPVLNKIEVKTIDGTSVYFYNHAELAQLSGGSPGISDLKKLVVDGQDMFRAEVKDTKTYNSESNHLHNLDITIPSTVTAGDQVTIDLRSTDGSIYATSRNPQQLWTLEVEHPNGNKVLVLKDERKSLSNHRAEYTITQPFNVPGTYVFNFSIQDVSFHSDETTGTNNYSVKKSMIVLPKDGGDPDPDPTDPTDPSPINITADLTVTPSNIAYRDAFRMDPLNINVGETCTYESHQFRIQRGGSTWTSTEIKGMNQGIAFTELTYPWVIAAGTHTVSIKVKTTNCGESDWLGHKTLTITTPTHNHPPDFVVAWTRPGTNDIVNTAIQGEFLDLQLLLDSVIDPDGDLVHWEGFDFDHASTEWLRNIHGNNKMSTIYSNVRMDALGWQTIQASMRDTWGARTTRTASVNVISPNPVAVITGSTEVVEGRPLDQPISGENSYSPVNRAIVQYDWTNKHDVYHTVGEQIITLDVMDSDGLWSETTATHTLTVKPDLPPVAALDYIPIGIRGNPVQITHASYSPDNDEIVEARIQYWYDANNNGTRQSNEPLVNVTLDSHGRFTITPSQVGKYYMTVFVKEDWGKTNERTFILDIVNESPFVTFNMESKVTEPQPIEFIHMSPSSFMSSSWQTVSPHSSSAAKNWTVNPNTHVLTNFDFNDVNIFKGYVTNTEERVNLSFKTMPTKNLQSYRLTHSPTGSNPFIGHMFGLKDDYYVKESMFRASDAANAPYVRGIKVLTTSGNRLVLNTQWNCVEVDLIDYDREIIFVRSSYELACHGGSSAAYSFDDFIAGINNPLTGVERNILPGVNQTYEYVEYMQTQTGNPPTVTDIKVVKRQWDRMDVPSSPQNYSGFWPNPPIYDGGSYRLMPDLNDRTMDPRGNGYYKLYECTYCTTYEIVKTDQANHLLWRTGYVFNGVGELFFSNDASRVIFQESHDRVRIINANTGGVVRTINNFRIEGVYNDHIVGMNLSNHTVVYNMNGAIVWQDTKRMDMLSDNGVIIFSTLTSEQMGPYDMERRIKLSLADVMNGSLLNEIEVPIYAYNMAAPIAYNHSYRLNLDPDGNLLINGYYSESYSGCPGNCASYSTFAAVVKGVIDENRYDTKFSQLYNSSGPDLDNFELRYELRNTLVQKEGFYSGFSFHMQNNRTMYRVETDGVKLRLVKLVNGNKTILRSMNYAMDRHEFYEFRVKSINNKITVYVNGLPLIEHTDASSPLIGGTIGPYTDIPAVEFRNISYADFDATQDNTLNNIALVDTPITYNVLYDDPENDPRIAALDEWKYEHVSQKFLNAGDGKSGTSSHHNKTYASPLALLDKVGMYRVTYTATDDPHPSYRYANMTFHDYRQQSNSYVQYLIVHRKPMVNFTLGINPDNTVRWHDTSYDPDRWLSSSHYSTENTGIDYRNTRGIVERKYYYVTPSGHVVESMLVAPTETGTYFVGMAVKDEYGAWSEFLEVELDVTQLTAPDDPPIAGFNVNPTLTYRNANVTVTSTASDNEDGGAANLSHEYWVRNITTGSAETLLSTHRGTWTTAFTELGTYEIRQVVTDSKGQTAQLIRQVNINNRIPTTAVTYPTASNQSNPQKIDVLRPTFTWNYSDADGDPQAAYRVQVFNYSNALILDSGVVSSANKSWQTSIDLPEGINMYVVVRTFDGYGWSNDSPRRYFYIQTNSPPTAGFVWTPNIVWEGDQVTLQHRVSDPDNNNLRVRYQVTDPDGIQICYPGCTSFYSLTPAQYHSDGPTFQVSKPGSYSIRQIVTDSIDPEVTLTKTFQVGELNVTAFVLHAEQWDKNRLDFNLKNPDESRPEHYFWAGERFMLEAQTTITNTSTEAIRVGVRMNSFFEYLIHQNIARTFWKGEMYDDEFDNLPNGDLNFTFTAEWNNGVIKEHVVTIRISNKWTQYFQLHRVK